MLPVLSRCFLYLRWTLVANQITIGIIKTNGLNNIKVSFIDMNESMIAAIANVETHTRVEDEEVSHCLKIEGSKVIEQTLSTQPKGTSIAVKSLFYNIPARRNFLKSDGVELRHVIDEFHRVAIAHPEIKFLFFNNGTELFDLPEAKFRKRIVGIFGNKLDAFLVPVEETTSLATLNGFVLKPTHAKKTRGQQFFFVNNRFIRSPFLHHAVNTAITPWV